MPSGRTTTAPRRRQTPVTGALFFLSARPDLFEDHFADVDPSTLDWDGDGEITLEEVAPGGADGYHEAWLHHLLGDRFAEEGAVVARRRR